MSAKILIVDDEPDIVRILSSLPSLRALPATRRLPVVLISARTSENAVQAAREAQAR
jgi:CheY-like chemotaxis protein